MSAGAAIPLFAMKPSARKVLVLLRTHDRVTTSQMLSCGTRYGARIGELRALGELAA